MALLGDNDLCAMWWDNAKSAKGSAPPPLGGLVESHRACRPLVRSALGFIVTQRPVSPCGGADYRGLCPEALSAGTGAPSARDVWLIMLMDVAAARGEAVLR
jgi:hypothetical protein